MESKRSVLPVLFALCAILLFLSVAVVYAGTSENSALAASLDVNSYVDTSITQSTLSFGSLDPATSNTAATENPVALTNTANSNTAIDVYLNNSNMTTAGANIPYYNLSVFTSDNAAASNALNGSTWINSTSANTGYVENLAVSASTNLYFWQDVPAAQQAGAYTATVTIRSVANGGSP